MASSGPAASAPGWAPYGRARALVSSLIEDLRLSPTEVLEDAYWPTVYLPAVMD